MNKIVATGKTIEQATQAALKRLGAKEDQVRINVLTEPTKGLFGFLGGRLAEVEVEIISDPLVEAKEFLMKVCSSMGLFVQLEEDKKDDHVVLRLKGENLGVLIGRRGQTLDSLQYLVNLVGNKQAKRHVRIVLDAEEYRDRRRQTLEKLAERLAAKAVHLHTEVVLEPMAAHERKIIHSSLQNRTDVVTKSQGEEPFRKVVITPLKKDRDNGR